MNVIDEAWRRMHGEAFLADPTPGKHGIILDLQDAARRTFDRAKPVVENAMQRRPDLMAVADAHATTLDEYLATITWS